MSNLKMRRETVVFSKSGDDDFNVSSEDSEPENDDIPMEFDLTAAGPPLSDDTDIEKGQEKQTKVLKYAKIILPHVGLVLLLIVYLLIGAKVFHSLEEANERLTKEKELQTIFGLRDSFHDNIWNLTQSGNTIISRESFNSLGQEYFEQLVKNIFQAYRNQFINERHLLNRTNGEETLWTFPNSVFFATTVITTIGYGNLVPATFGGRIACILFALLGIPLLLVTIADIGKFLSDLFSYLYKSYRVLVRKLKKQSRRISHHYKERSMNESQHSGCSTPIKAGSINLNEMDTDSEESSDQDALRIPIIMVLLVLVVYTALGGLLFQSLEGWSYFEAFYFCFITMATVGFGDIVPTDQFYMFFTMAYIILGLSLATMCIDLAGTEYIRKIHYIGTKMGDAKGAVITGLQVGENLLKHTGIDVIRTAGGKIVQVRGAVLNTKQARELDYILADLQYQQKNILYEPLSQAVQKLVKDNNIKILPNDITDTDGYIVQNKSYDKPVTKQLKHINASPNIIHRLLIPSNKNASVLYVPFVLKESDI
uniref:Potassium channel subfamily K member 18 n=1 Tax=Parastrongyloides trichosuri TaxID=131310 RepID=A0A0N5A336_PARTI